MMKNRLKWIKVDPMFHKKFRIAAAEKDTSMANLSRDLAKDENDFMNNLSGTIKKKKVNDYEFRY